MLLEFKGYTILIKSLNWSVTLVIEQIIEAIITVHNIKQ